MNQTLTLLGLLLAGPLTAQVPDGWHVHSAYGSGSYAVAEGGLFVTHPRKVISVPRPITGLSTDLTGGIRDNVYRGANAVAIEPDTGHLLVGETGPRNTTIDLHRLSLTGLAATTLSKTLIGQVAASGSNAKGEFGITGIAMLANGDAVLSVAGLANLPPLKGAHLARYSPVSGTVTPISTTGIVGTCTAVAASLDGSKIYFHMIIPLRFRTILYEVSVAGGTPRVVWGAASGIRSLAVESDGRILAAQSTYILRIDPTTGKFHGAGAYNITTTAVTTERATGFPIVLAADPSSQSGVFWTDRSTSKSTRIASGVLATASGIAVRHSPRAFGRGSSGLATYKFFRMVFPQIGLPVPGNTSFAIQIRTTGPAQPGVLLISPKAATGTLIGVRVNIDLSSAFVLGVIRPDTAFALPIPANLTKPAFGYLQGFFPDSGAPSGIGSSNGLRIGLIE